jgi:NACalpha-BTF3-like transcription factor
MEDMNSQGPLSASQQLAGSGVGNTTAPDPSRTGKGSENPDDVPELEAPEDDDPVDETGVDPKDIELVMAQVNCSRAKAVRVLKENSGDLINASVSISIHICGPTSDFFVLPISYGGERMILFASAGYCTSVKKFISTIPLPRSLAIYLSV